jgi:hypothetical protein
MLEFEDSALEPFAMDGFQVPLLKMNHLEVPSAEIVVGGEKFRYARSFPIKGYGAIMPGYLRGQLDAGKRPLVAERLNRYFVYLAAEE